MIYTYQASLYCKECGERIRKSIALPDGADIDDEYSYDSDDYPKPFYGENESDSVDHCECGADCLNAINLRDYGMPESAPLFGAESFMVGVIVTDSLTLDGVEYVKQSLGEVSQTPYQVALMLLWAETFENQLEYS